MLHIVNQSPYQSSTLASCLRLLQPGHSLLLIEDAVYAADSAGSQQAALQQAAARAKVYALKPDVEARGLGQRVMENVTLIDYSGFVTLVAETSTSHSWL